MKTNTYESPGLQFRNIEVASQLDEIAFRGSLPNEVAKSSKARHTLATTLLLTSERRNSRQAKREKKMYSLKDVRKSCKYKYYVPDCLQVRRSGIELHV